MADVLCDVEGTVCWMDDILLHGKYQEEYDRLLMDVWQRLQDAGFTLNEKKYESRVTFLGDQEGLRPACFLHHWTCQRLLFSIYSKTYPP